MKKYGYIYWTDHEVDFLKEHAGKMSLKELYYEYRLRFPDSLRTFGSIAAAVERRLGTRIARYTHEQELWLLEHSELRNPQLGMLFRIKFGIGKTNQQIYMKRLRLKLEGRDENPNSL